MESLHLTAPTQNLIHIQSSPKEILFVDPRVRRVSRHKISFATFLTGIAMAGKKEQEAIICLETIFVDEILKCLAQSLTIGIDYDPSDETVSIQCLFDLL